MSEEKYMPDISTMSLAEQPGAALAFKKMAERRFKRFESDIQEVIERGRYDEEDFKNVKDLRKDKSLRDNGVLEQHRYWTNHTISP